MYKRFRALKGVIRTAIIDQDVLGLQAGLQTQQEPPEPPGNQAFAFERDADKIEQFMDWLREQEEKGVLETRRLPQVGQAIEGPWTNTFVQSAYRQGAARGRSELRQAGYDAPEFEDVGGLDAILNAPFHADRLGLIYTRTFRELRGITEAMDQEISRQLAQGLAEGRNPREMARTINDRIDKIGLTRARTLARTETIRAHHTATIQEYRNFAVEGVVVIAEWQTAQDARVCPRCQGLQGREFDLEQIEGMIPLHPNCRCIALPLDRTDAEQGTQPPETDPVTEDPVASRFTNREDGEVYLQEKARFDQEFAEWSDEDIALAHRIGREEEDAFSEEEWNRGTDLRASLERTIRNDLPEARQTITEWKGSTQGKKPTALKQAAAVMERGLIAPARIAEGMSEDQIRGVLVDQVDDQLRREYLRLRAFNQAYQDRIGIDSEKLYRGIAGPEGNRISDQIANSPRRNKWPSEEQPLAGFSSSETIAERFAQTAPGGKGLYYKVDLDKSEIVVNTDLLSVASGGVDLDGELEFIVLGGRREINREDITVTGR